ncbi:MAG: hypothetical protein L0H55_14465 [Candidatus Nitrosocosmicus sp.]|nr:hypothetical protein [Candidatus Nitrosocosmicus sp.]
MDFMIAAAVAAILNIGLLGTIIAIYVQNTRLIKSYFTYGLITIASAFMIQNIVIVIFWFNLYTAGPSIKAVVDAAAPYLFIINLAQTVGLAVMVWINAR